MPIDRLQLHFPGLHTLAEADMWIILMQNGKLLSEHCGLQSFRLQSPQLKWFPEVSQQVSVLYLFHNLGEIAAENVKIWTLRSRGV